MKPFISWLKFGSTDKTTITSCTQESVYFGIGADNYSISAIKFYKNAASDIFTIAVAVDL